MNFDLKKDREFIEWSVQNTIGKKVMSVTPVLYSYTDFKTNINPGRVLFFGVLTVNPRLPSAIGINSAYFLRLAGKMRYLLISGMDYTSCPVLFDDILANGSFPSSVNADDPSYMTGDRSIAHPSLAVQFVPFISFAGYKINVGG